MFTNYSSGDGHACELDSFPTVRSANPGVADSHLVCDLQGLDLRRPWRFAGGRLDQPPEVNSMFQNPQPPAFPLEHEKLIAYREAYLLLEMIETLGSLPGEFDLRDQLSRASASILLNIGEGASRYHAADKRRFYVIARGSLGEVGAALDLLRIRRRLSSDRHSELRSQLVRVARLLGGLCRAHE